MKKLWLIFAALTAIVVSVQAADFFSSINKSQLHEFAKRKQRLVFVPEKPGMETGSWRICWENGEKIAELLLTPAIKLPACSKKLRIEMDIECAPGTTLLSADMRVQDAKGEICAFNSNRGGSSTGNITAVWELTPGQKVYASWGRNVDKILNLPGGGIANLAFRLENPVGDITIKTLRIIPDPQN